MYCHPASGGKCVPVSDICVYKTIESMPEKRRRSALPLVCPENLYNEGERTKTESPLWNREDIRRIKKHKKAKKSKKKKNKAQKSIGYSLTYKSQVVKYSKMK